MQQLDAEQHHRHDSLQQSDQELDVATTRDARKVTNAFEIQHAYGRLAKYLRRTPLLRAHTLDRGFNVFYKCDHSFWTGSFKERGVVNTMLLMTAEEKSRGVIAASAGNHALALAYHGKRFGIPVTVVMPTIAPLTKIENCGKYGARVILHGSNIAESRAHAEKIREEQNQLYINGFDDPAIVNGAGTCGIEILEQLPDVGAIVIPVGGGGLVAGVAVAAKQRNPSVRIVAVESEACPSFSAALKKGSPVTVATKSTIADGLQVPTVGAHSFSVAQKLVDEVVVVEEKFIALGVLRLLETEKLLVEGGAAVCVSAILSGKLDHLRGMKVVVILSGGNIDITTLGRVIERGLYIDHRLLRLTATVDDQPGGLGKFCAEIGLAGGSIKDIMQERPFIQSNKVTVVRTTIETRGQQHMNAVLAALRKAGFSVRVDTDDDVIPPRPKL